MNIGIVCHLYSERPCVPGIGLEKGPGGDGTLFVDVRTPSRAPFPRNPPSTVTRVTCSCGYANSSGACLMHGVPSNQAVLCQ